MQGWLKLYRQLAENPIWLLKPFSEGQAWVDLLMITTFDSGFIKTKNGTIIKLNRGQCGFSQLTLSERWGWSRGKVNRYLKLLENEKMIQQKIVANTTIINILNYDNFQNDTINNTINDTINGQQTIQQTDTIKNDNNDNNEKNIISISEKTKKIDPYSNEYITHYEKCYKKIIGANNCFLLQMHRDKINELAETLKDKYFDSVETVLKRLKKLNFQSIGFKPNTTWLLKDDNYIKLLEGSFETETEAISSSPYSYAD